MSYLIRTGNGRTNISWSTVTNTSTRYLRRTSTGRNNIVWTTIPSGSTYNILNRTGTGRNNIAWGNLKIGPDLSATGLQNNMHLTTKEREASTGRIYDMGWGTMNANNTGYWYGISGFVYENNRFKSSSPSYSTRLYWDDLINQYAPSYSSQLIGYSLIILCVSSTPSSDYLQSISSVTSTSGVNYNVRFAPVVIYINQFYENLLFISINYTGLFGSGTWINFA